MSPLKKVIKQARPSLIAQEPKSNDDSVIIMTTLPPVKDLKNCDQYEVVTSNTNDVIPNSNTVWKGKPMSSVTGEGISVQFTDVELVQKNLPTQSDESRSPGFVDVPLENAPVHKKNTAAALLRTLTGQTDFGIKKDKKRKESEKKKETQQVQDANQKNNNKGTLLKKVRGIISPDSSTDVVSPLKPSNIPASPNKENVRLSDLLVDKENDTPALRNTNISPEKKIIGKKTQI